MTAMGVRHTQQTRKRSTGIASMLVVLALLGACLCVLFPAHAEALTLKQTEATSSTATIQWDDPRSSNPDITCLGYSISISSDYSGVSATREYSADNTIIRFTGLASGMWYRVDIDWKYKVKSTGATKQAKFGSINIATRVAKPQITDFEQWYTPQRGASFSWKVQPAANKVQYQVSNAATGKRFKTITIDRVISDYTISNLKKNTVYAVQLRVADSTGWSAWSKKFYIAPQPKMSAKTKIKSGKLSVGWSKVRGASSYSVYVSSKAQSGFKKVATVKAGKTKAVVKRFKGKSFRSGKTYYVYVAANKKAGGKTYTSGGYYVSPVKASAA